MPSNSIKLLPEHQFRLSQNTLQSLKILQMDRYELEQYIEEVLYENPVLTGELNCTSRDDEFECYWSELRGNRDEYKTLAFPKNDSSLDYLIDKAEYDTLVFFIKDQLARRKISDQTRSICGYMAELLDERGYLAQEDIDDMVWRIGLPRKAVSEALREFHSLEPAGVGARNLQECLLLQLNRMDVDFNVEREIVRRFFEDFSRKRYKQIEISLEISVERMKLAITRISTMNPFPAEEFQGSTALPYIIPDAYLIIENNHMEVFSNDNTPTQVGVNSYYVELADQINDEAAKSYLIAKTCEAYNVQKAIIQRRQTFMACVRLAVERQRAFFLSGGKEPLAPMLQSELAEELGVHETTVGRAIRGRYLQTSFGSFLVKDLFNKPLGGADTSSQRVERMIADIVKNEDKKAPYSDLKIVEIIQEQGLTISRRIITKYRLKLGIESSYMRKEK